MKAHVLHNYGGHIFQGQNHKVITLHKNPKGNHHKQKTITLQIHGQSAQIHLIYPTPWYD